MNSGAGKISPAELVDIRSVQIDPTLPVEERVRSYLAQIGNSYLFCVGDTVVHVCYADTQRTINDNLMTLISTI